MNKNVISKITSNDTGNDTPKYYSARNISSPILTTTNSILLNNNNYKPRRPPTSNKFSLLNIFPKSSTTKNLKIKVNFSPGEEAYRNYYCISSLHKNSKSDINPLLIKDTHSWNVSSQDLEKMNKFPRDYTIDNATCQLRKIENAPNNKEFKTINPIIKWNRSTEIHERFLDYSKEENHKMSRISLVSRNNSRNYWKKYQEKRINSMPYELSENRNLVEIQRFYKPYVTPVQKYEDKIKEVNKAKLEVYKKKDLYYRMILDDYKNIKADDAWKLVDEKLEKERREKTKSIFSKNNTRNNYSNNERYSWSDKEISEKIIKLSDLNSVFENIDSDSLSSYNYSRVSKSIKDEDFLKNLINKRKNIEETEKLIKSEIYNNLKQKSFRRNMSNRSFLDCKNIKYNIIESTNTSRYPMSKEQYELNKEKSENDIKSHAYYNNKYEEQSLAKNLKKELSKEDLFALAYMRNYNK